MPAEIEIIVGDVNDIEARVLARYCGAPEGERVTLHGTLRGPYCSTARTLPAVCMFHQTSDGADAEAEVIVPDPCTWTSELPHVYQADVVARLGETIVAEYHAISIGARRASKGSVRSYPLLALRAPIITV
jgi:hypothetical protein